MELKQLNRLNTVEYKRSSGYTRHTQGSFSPSSGSRISKFNLIALSPFSLRTNHKLQRMLEPFAEIAKQSKKLPGINESYTKKLDRSLKLLKYSPARFQVMSSPEKISEKKIILPAIDSDLQLLKDINTKSDHEAFLEDLMLRNLKNSCREEITHVNRQKRVRFQII